MTPGLALFYGGMVRKKNLLSAMLQSFIAMSVISLLWVLVGFSLSFGDSLGGFIGNPFTYIGFRNVGLYPNVAFASTIPFALFALFQMKFAIIAPALITGAFAERISFKSYLIFLIFFSIFIYASVAHWTWHPDGFLRKMGVLDFAGGTVVHITAGVAALVAAIMMRRRVEIEHTPTNIPFVMLGTAMLWFGWFGFNSGSALAANAQSVQAFLTTNVASSTGMLLTAVLAQDVGLIHGNWHTMLAHLAGLAIVVTYTAFATYLGFTLIRKFTPLEVSPTAEALGLDIDQHGEIAGDSFGSFEDSKAESLLPQYLFSDNSDNSIKNTINNESTRKAAITKIINQEEALL